MKIIKFALPVIALVAIGSYSAHQELIRQAEASKDAGALPETKIIVEKIYRTSLEKNLEKQARLASR